MKKSFLTPWSFALLRRPAGNFIIVEVVSYPIPHKEDGFFNGYESIMVRTIPQFPGTLLEVPVSALTESKPPKCVAFAEVSGRGFFPADMLRYDCAEPVNFKLNEEGIAVFTNTQWKDSFIIARAVPQGMIPSMAFTDARWSSFGWGIRHLKAAKIEAGAQA